MTVSSVHPIIAQDFRALLTSGVAWERLQGKSVLITGATGLVASYLVEALLYFNENSSCTPCTVIALVRDEQRAKHRFAHYRSRSDLRLLVQDVAEPLPSAVKANLFIHAAGNATPRSFGTDPIGTYRTAAVATHHLLEHAHRTGCEGFLFLSSGAVHGVVPAEDTVINEATMGVVDPLAPYACYAESKRMAETMCASWTRQSGLRTSIARLGHTYGPGLRRDDDRAFAQFVYAVVDRRDIVLHTDGAAVRPYCYLSDAAEALFRILLSGGNGEAYLLANTEATCSTRELAHLLSELMPDRAVRVRFDMSSNREAVVNRAPPRRLDVSKLHSLGWFPKVMIADGFRRTLLTLL